MSRDNLRPLAKARRAASPGAVEMRGLMARTGMPQADIAAALGCDVRTLRRWRAGEGTSILDARLKLVELVEQRGRRAA
jgi:DNA-binding transcriptional regulator YiaG